MNKAERALRIAMVVPYDITEPGGVKQHAFDLADSLRKLGDEVTLIGPASWSIEEPHYCQFAGVMNIVSNGSDNRIGALVSGREVRRYFRKHAFDIIHVHEPLTPGLPYYVAWATRGVPKIATFHAYAEHSSRSLLLGRAFCSPLILPLIHHAIAVSEPAGRHAHINWKRPLPIVPIGIQTERFYPEPSTLPPTLRLLFVGRHSDERKGFRYLIQAFRSLLASGVPATLEVVGDGTPALDLIEPGVICRGRLSEHDLVYRYQNCDIFIAPSTSSESFGLVLLQAMAVGCAIICSNIEGYRQLAISSGCLLIPPADALALQSAIENLASKPSLRMAMGESNHTYAQAFDCKKLAPLVRREYLQAIEFCRLRALRRCNRRPVSSQKDRNSIG